MTELSLALPGRANRSNAVMALAVAEVFGVSPAAALQKMRSVTSVAGRYTQVERNGRQVRLLLAKNPAGWLEAFDVLEPAPVPVLLSVNAQVPDGRDTSWLWDVDYRVVRDRPVLVSGERGLDLAVRLEADGVAFEMVGGIDDAVSRVRPGRDPGRHRQLHRVPADPHGRRPGGVTTARPAPRYGAHHGKGPTSGGRGAHARGPGNLRLVWVYPDLLSTYGDRGNLLVLERRARLRGIGVEAIQVNSDQPVPAAGRHLPAGRRRGPPAGAGRPPAGHGRGTGRRGRPGLGGLRGLRGLPAGRRGIRRGPGPARAGAWRSWTSAAGGATAGGSGKSWPTSIPALGVPRLTGFENHQGVTRIGPGARPLARVLTGVGNGDGTEGAYAGRVLGTYLHGPALVRNPALADLLLSWAVGALPPLDAEYEAWTTQFRDQRLAAVPVGSA